MTLEKARQLLGKEYEDKSDKEIFELLSLAGTFSDLIIDFTQELYQKGGLLALDKFGEKETY